MVDAEYVQYLAGLEAREVTLARRLDWISQNAGRVMAGPAIVSFLVIWIESSNLGLDAAAAFMLGATAGWIGFAVLRDELMLRAAKASTHRWAVINAIRAHAMDAQKSD